MNKLPLIILITTIISCSRPADSLRIGELNSLIIDSTDFQMNSAIDLARQTLTEFDQAFDNENSGYSSFTMKVNIDGKQVWLYAVTPMGNGKYMGELSTGEPGVQLGGKVIEIDKANICDWMYLDGNKLIGGQTIRVQYQRMTSDQKKVFDKKNRLTF